MYGEQLSHELLLESSVTWQEKSIDASFISLSRWFHELQNFNESQVNVREVLVYTWKRTPEAELNVYYRIAGNFQHIKISVMEMFDHRNIQKNRPIAKFIYIRKFTFNENYLCKNAGRKISTVLPQVPAQALLQYFFYDNLEPALKRARVFILPMQCLKLLICCAKIA